MFLPPVRLNSSESQPDKGPVTDSDLISFGLLILGVGAFGLFFIIVGAERGRRLGKVDPGEVLHMVVEGKTPSPSLFGESRAHGKLPKTGEAVDVTIFSTQYDDLEPGNMLAVHRLGNGRSDFVSHAKYEESLPLYRVAGCVVSWHFVPGIATCLIPLIIGIWFIIASRSAPPENPASRDASTAQQNEYEAAEVAFGNFLSLFLFGCGLFVAIVIIFSAMNP